ncbi:MAG TPA: VacJ family lipoprotein [Desulfocapsa sulfexigens]|nr:VacJ family lipoprotein [Desulfocapsa sulfexigens]
MKVSNKSKYVKFFLMTFLLFLSVGCAQKKNDSLVQNQGAGVGQQESRNDEMDILLSDDFYDAEFPSATDYYDPLEPMNRIFFEFNDKVYYWVLSPMNNVYTAVLPVDIRYSIGNFFNNIAAPVRLLNNVLQGKISDAGVVLSRFLINSTLGVYGFGDPALIEFGLEPKLEDFGQTLGYWGLGEGIYFCWPIIGPSSVRDTFGFAGDVATHPMVYFVNDFRVSAGYYGAGRVNLLSLNPDVYEDLKKYALDPYVSMRQVYLDYRRNKVGDSALKQRSDNEL